MGPGCRVYHDASTVTSGLMNPVDEFTFMIGLAKFDLQTVRGSSAFTQIGDISQCFVAVSGRLTSAQHVQVRAIEHQDYMSHCNDLHCFFHASAEAAKQAS